MNHFHLNIDNNMYIIILYCGIRSSRIMISARRLAVDGWKNP